MRLVFSLREKLHSDPEHVRQVQKVTQGASTLPGGLKDTFGLFGSEEWWQNIEDGVAPVTKVVGIIGTIFREGMNNEGLGFEVVSGDGKAIYRYSCVSNNKADRKLYVAGKRCELSFVTVPMKNPVRWGRELQTHSEIVLSIWIEE